jgi:hypothetical protein
MLSGGEIFYKVRYIAALTITCFNAITFEQKLSAEIAKGNTKMSLRLILRLAPQILYFTRTNAIELDS